jgi:TPR repeat protein
MVAMIAWGLLTLLASGPGAGAAEPTITSEPRAVSTEVRFSEAYTAYSRALVRGDLAAAARLLLEAAESGDSHAAAAVARAFERGALFSAFDFRADLTKDSVANWRIPMDLSRAETWYRKAIASGDPNHIVSLACLLFRKDSAYARWEAFNLMSSAAAKGDGKAKVYMSAYLRRGFAGQAAVGRADTLLLEALRPSGVDAHVSAERERVDALKLDLLRSAASSDLAEGDCAPTDERGSAIASVIVRALREAENGTP